MDEVYNISNKYQLPNEGMKEQCQMFYFKNIFVADLSGSQHLFEIFQTSLTVKNSEEMVKSGCFEKCSLWRAPIFFRNEGDIKSLE